MAIGVTVVRPNRAAIRARRSAAAFREKVSTRMLSGATRGVRSDPPRTRPGSWSCRCPVQPEPATGLPGDRRRHAASHQGRAGRQRHRPPSQPVHRVDPGLGNDQLVRRYWTRADRQIRNRALSVSERTASTDRASQARRDTPPSSPQQRRSSGGMTKRDPLRASESARSNQNGRSRHAQSKIATAAAATSPVPEDQIAESSEGIEVDRRTAVSDQRRVRQHRHAQHIVGQDQQHPSGP